MTAVKQAERTEVAGVCGRILVADDEPGIRMMMQRMLGDYHEVVAVGSGREARAILEQDRSFDLILCDLMMPDVTGMELHAWLAEQNPALAARMVFITGGAFTPKAAQYVAQAGNRCVDKPFDAAKVKKMAAELVLASSRSAPTDDIVAEFK